MCKTCAQTFDYQRRPGQRGRFREFCSQQCARQSKRLKPIECASCRAEFRPWPSSRAKAQQRYCSFACRPQNVGHALTPAPRLYASKLERWSARRARLRNALVEQFPHAEIFERDGWTCGICREPVERGPDASRDRRASLDHVLPLSRGGLHTRANVQCTHWICNSRKTDGRGLVGF